MNQSNQSSEPVLPPLPNHDVSQSNEQKINGKNHSQNVHLNDETLNHTLHTLKACHPKSQRRPFRDAAELQVSILNASKDPKVTPNTLSQLAKAWVSLESQKMAIRQERLALRQAGLARPPRGPKPLPNELRPTGDESSFVESLPAELAAEATAAGVQTRKAPQKVPRAIIQPEPEKTQSNPPGEKPKAKGIYSTGEG